MRNFVCVDIGGDSLMRNFVCVDIEVIQNEKFRM